MFEICENFLVQFVSLFPTLLAFWLIFDLTGGLLFGKK